MAWLKKSSLFAALLFAAAAACVVQGWFIYRFRERSKLAAIQLEAKRTERDWLARQKPALTEENARAIAADVAAAEKSLEELRIALEGRGWLPPAPARPIDAYFAFASFHERMRALGMRERIALRADERFGFATYANEGPEREVLDAVHRQRVVLQHVLETLFESHPKALVAAVRERPLTVAQRAARRAASREPGVNGNGIVTTPAARSDGQLADFFEPDARLRLQAPGLADGELYRVEFTGQTQTLRAFLNSLAQSPLPLFVRAVEVEPEERENSSMSDGVPVSPVAASAPVPLVTGSFSKFTVVLECVEVLIGPSTP